MRRDNWQARLAPLPAARDAIRPVLAEKYGMKEFDVKYTRPGWYAGASIYVGVSGAANDVTVSSGGKLSVSSGFTALSGASLYFYVAPGTFVSGTSEDWGEIAIRDGVASGFEITQFFGLEVISGGSAVDMNWTVIA